MFSIRGIVFHDYFMTNVVYDSTPKVTIAGVTVFLTNHTTLAVEKVCKLQKPGKFRHSYMEIKSQNMTR